MKAEPGTERETAIQLGSSQTHLWLDVVSPRVFGLTSHSEPLEEHDINVINQILLLL